MAVMGENADELPVTEFVEAEEAGGVDRLEDDWAAMLAEDGVTAEGEIIEQETGEGAEAESNRAPAVIDQNKVAAAELVIANGARFLIGVVFQIPVAEAEYKKFANPVAVAICKYYRGGILEFLAEWKEVFTAIGATAIFTKAVNDAYKIKKQQEADNKKLKGVASDQAEAA